MKTILPAPLELFKMSGVVVLYSLMSLLVHLYFNPGKGDSIFALASGVALAALLIGGKRYFWAVFLGALISSLWIGDVFWVGVIKALGNALAAWTGAWLIRRDGGFDTSLPSLRDIKQILLRGGTGSAVSAIIGTTTLLFSGVVTSDNYLARLVAWWMGDALGILLMTPLILVWWPTASNPIPRPQVKLLAEAVLVLLATVVIGSIISLGWRPEIMLPEEIHWFFDTVSQGYWLFLLISWAAIRLGMRGTTLTLLLASTIAVIGFYQGTGYFGLAVGHMVSFWYFTVSLSLVGMTLATYIAANKTLTQSLLKSEAALGQELKNVMAALNRHAMVTAADVRGRITTVNDKFCEISGYSRDEIVGQYHRILNSGLHPDEFFKDMYRAITAGQIWHGEICNRAKDARLYWVQTTISPFMDDGGKPAMYVAISSDITSRKVNEIELLRHRDHLEEMVQQKTSDVQQNLVDIKRALTELERQKFMINQHAVVSMTDIAGRIYYANDKFSKVSGFPLEEYMWQDHIIVNSGCHPKGFFKEMYETIARGEVWHADVCNRAKDGHLYWLDSTVTVFMGEDGKPSEYIMVGIDITERKYAEAAALAASHAKSEFLANMSHEIRTPMNGVIGMVDILQKTRLTAVQSRMLDTIHDSSLALLQILNDILDSAKIEAGKLSMESIPTHLREVVEGAVQLMATAAHAKSIELSVFVSPELPRRVASDPTRLRQVLLNLLGNAVKFTSRKEGRVSRVALRVEPCTLDSGLPGIQMRVTDNGIGMSAEVLAHLFRPFTQADESTARKFGGTGLGLSISKRLIEMMEGTISAGSTLGEGAEFTVKLPLRAAAPDPVPEAEASLAGVHVLAVSRDVALGQIVLAYCIAAGATVIFKDDMAAVREYLKQPYPLADATVVLLGSDVTLAANKLGLPASVGVVRLVMRDNGSHAAKEVRIPAYPLLYQDLINGVAQAGGQLVAREMPAWTERRSAKALSVEEALLAGRLILLAEDNETNREVMQAQLRLLGYTAEVAEDGVAALQMWSSGSYALLLTDCHMPNMDGFELTAAIRQHEPEGTRLPIIAVTANAMQGEFQRCLDLGMDDYLSKPLRLEGLKLMLDKWLPPAPASELMPVAGDGALEVLATDHANGEIEAMGHIDGESPDFISVWDAATLPRLVGDNPVMHRRLLEKFMSGAQEQVAVISAAAVTGDTRVVADIAHKLKSSARTVGAIQLGALCQRMETAGRASDAPACADLAGQLEEAFAAAENLIKECMV